MRELTSHKVNGLNESLEIQVLDEPGAGGANHVYAIYGFHAQNEFVKDATCLKMSFQNGPIKEAGVNGISQEALLAIVEDRLACFQSGPYACDDNAQALMKVREAMMCLQKRTRERMSRGVEGTHQK